MSLEEVKPGDKLFVSRLFSKSIETVERTTKTLVFTEQGSKFNRRGDIPGAGSWGRTYARLATEKDIEEVTLLNLRYKVSNIPSNTLTKEQCLSILQVVNQE